MEASTVIPPSSQHGRGIVALEGHRRVQDSHLSASAHGPVGFAPGSASAVLPTAGNPLLVGVQSAEQGAEG
jgi:hypothetical protein